MNIITVTSWLGRINQVADILPTLVNQTIKPDRIFINLSKTEFIGYELPEKLKKVLAENSDLIILNWVDGPNTKPFKKIFPILKYLNDDDFILDTDDDLLLPPHLLESRLAAFQKYQTAIVSSSSRKYFFINGYAGRLTEMKYPCLATTLFQKKMLVHWDEILDEDIIATNHDDGFYNTLLYLNGYLQIPDDDATAISKIYKTPFDIAIHGAIGCANAVQLTELVNKKFKEKFGCDMSFNYFKTNKNSAFLLEQLALTITKKEKDNYLNDPWMPWF